MIYTPRTNAGHADDFWSLALASWSARAYETPFTWHAFTPKARIPVGKGYQVPFSRQIRDEAHIMTGAVGLITDPTYANEIITGGDADMVLVARELLREPYWALKAQASLGEEPSWPIPYGYAVKRR